MKYILSVLFFIVFCQLVKAQDTTTNIYTPMNNAGYRFKYIDVDSGLNLPCLDTVFTRGVATGRIVLKCSDTTIYYYNGRYWKAIGSGSASVKYVDSVYYNDDSLCYIKNGVSYCTLLSTTIGNLQQVTDVGNVTNDSVISQLAFVIKDAESGQITGLFAVDQDINGNPISYIKLDVAGATNYTKIDPDSIILNTGTKINAGLYRNEVSPGNYVGHLKLTEGATSNELDINYGGLFFNNGTYSQTITPYPSPTQNNVFTTPNTTGYGTIGVRINGVTTNTGTNGVADLGAIGIEDVLNTDNVLTDDNSINQDGYGFTFAASGGVNVQLDGDNHRFLIRKYDGSKNLLSVGDDSVTVNGTFRVVNGTEQNGYVLTSDANGVATWQAPSSGSATLQSVTDVDPFTTNSLYTDSGFVVRNGGLPVAELKWNGSYSRLKMSGSSLIDMDNGQGAIQWRGGSTITGIGSEATTLNLPLSAPTEGQVLAANAPDMSNVTQLYWTDAGAGSSALFGVEDSIASATREFNLNSNVFNFRKGDINNIDADTRYFSTWTPRGFEVNDNENNVTTRLKSFGVEFVNGGTTQSLYKQASTAATDNYLPNTGNLNDTIATLFDVRSSQGIVTRHSPDGTFKTYPLSANTDEARGAALAAAIDDFATGDNITVTAGTYLTRINIKDGLNIYFNEGAIVEWDGNEAIINDEDEAGSITIDGRGVFHNTHTDATSGRVIDIERASSININAKSIISDNSVAVRASVSLGGGTQLIYANADLYMAADGVFDNLNEDCTMTLFGGKALSTEGFVLEQDGGLITSYIKTLQSLDAVPIVRASNGKIIVWGANIMSGDDANVYENTGATSDVQIYNSIYSTNKSNPFDGTFLGDLRDSVNSKNVISSDMIQMQTTVDDIIYQAGKEASNQTVLRLKRAEKPIFEAIGNDDTNNHIALYAANEDLIFKANAEDLSGQLNQNITWTANAINTKGFSTNYTKQSTDYTTSLSDYAISVDNGASSVTITFDATAPTGTIYVVKRFDATSLGTVTIEDGGSGTVQDIVTLAFGANTTLATAGAYGQIIQFQKNADGNWEIIN